MKGGIFMLIDFTVKNFTSFKDENSLSLLASVDKTDENIHVYSINDKIKILKNAAIFGANASGKSNLLKAFNFMQKYVINSSKESQLGDTIDVEPFKFNAETEKQPSLFEVTFLQESVIYRYGFEAVKTEIVSEWLFARYSSRESTLFIRKNQDITLGEKFKEGRKYITSVRNNALFLSVCAQFNGEISSNLIDWFRNVSVISSLDNNYANYAVQILDNEDGKYSEQKEMLLHLITSIDVGIEDLSIEVDEKLDLKKFIESMPMKQAGKLLDELKKYESKDSEDNQKGIKISTRRVTSLHKKFDSNNTMISLENCNFNIESKGTRKIFELSGLIIKTIFDGGVLFIDEIQNSLHPNLIVGLINFINHNEKNKNAQFIYTTHEVLILATKLLRRDQYWFVEKNKFGASELSCLFDFEEPIRKDASLDKDYLRGRYGAIPYLNL
jgi:AAA15 family ATPase/GTPase